MIRPQNRRLELQGGDIVLGLGHQVHGDKPAGERQFGRIEDGAHRDRGLVPTAMALPVGPTFPNEPGMAFVTALGAAETVRPARGDQRRIAFLFRPVALHETSHRQSALKLNLVDRHFASHQQRCVHFQSPTGSLREPAEVGG